MDTFLTWVISGCYRGYQEAAKGVMICFHFFIAPRKKDEDERRTELILNSILFSTLVCILYLDLSVAYAIISRGDEYYGVGFIPFTLVLLFFGGLYVLSRIGKVQLSSHLFVATLYFSTTYAVAKWGFDLPIGLLSYVLTVVVSGIILGSRACLFVTLLICTTLISVGYVQLHNIFPVESYWRLRPPNFRNTFQESVFLVIIMLISFLANMEIKKSLDRARRSERELTEERDSLEIKIEGRTKELKRVQMEKMTQVYRFVELGRLSSGVFHDLVSPLTALRLNIDEVKKLQGDTSGRSNKIYHCLNQSIAAAKRMSQLIDIIDKQSKTQEVIVHFDPLTEIGQAIEIISYKARKAQVKIEVQSSGQETIFGNPIKFHQIITNLLSNAIDAFDGIERTSKTVTVTLEGNQDHLTLSIRDNACGISSDILPKIFDPFFTTKSSHKGTGLGLSTTKEIAEKEFSGSISVESTPGEGSTFTVTLQKQKTLHYGITPQGEDAESTLSSTNAPAI